MKVLWSNHAAADGLRYATPLRPRTVLENHETKLH